MFVYVITNDVNDKVYVGLHFGPDLRRRWITHKSFARRGISSSPINRAMLAHGIEKFHITSLWSGHTTPEKLKSLERYFIRCLKSKSPNGYNLTEGGDGACGFRHTEEGKAKRSEKMRMQMASGNINPRRPRDPEMCRLRGLKHRGQKHGPMTKEQRERISLARIGNKNALGFKQSAETIAKKVASRAGYRHSEETKRKMSESQKIRCAKRNATD